MSEHIKRTLILLGIAVFAAVRPCAAEDILSPAANALNAVIAPVVEETAPAAEPVPEAVPAAEVPLSKDLLTQAWALNNDLGKLNAVVEQALALYGEEAKQQQASLSGFPIRGKEGDYKSLNDVGTILFVKAEALMNQGKVDEAVPLFERIIKEYKYAQAWDPSRGAYWSIAEKGQASIDVMQGKVKPEDEDLTVPPVKILPRMSAPGTEKVVDYLKYGEFIGVGTPQYAYKINDPKGLSDAVGEGIYPNTGAILKDPGYKKAKEEGRLEGTHWDFVHVDDLEAAFYKWATASEPGGVKLFYLATILEKAGMIEEAIKAYHAIIIHFPKSVGRTYWQTPWYPGQAAVAKIKHLVRTHPELNLQVRWMRVQVVNGLDNDINNDSIITYPGTISKKSWFDLLKEQLNLHKKEVKLGKVKRTLGQGKVQLVQYENGHWQMMVEGKPYVIRGMNYSPTKIGQSPDKKTLVSWMDLDSNKNGKPDGPYDAWVDANKNGQRDENEPVVGDFQLMKEMGVNTIREYHQPEELNKETLRAMFEQYGIRVAIGDFFGKYTLGSGASWFEGTDYENPKHQENMLASVRKMVMDYKDEPFVLMWILGNENNYGVASNADKKPEAYYKFLNEAAKLIKSLDPDHPVAVCNGDTLYLDIFAKNAPDVDMFGGNLYRGDYGFGAYWEQVLDAADKPAFVTEFGAPAYAKHMTLAEAEKAQAAYHRGNWMDIEDNRAGRADGAGNAVGGFVFAWVDEWWKNYEPYYHDRKSDAIGPFPGGYYYEEWFGITSQGAGQHSPFLRELREAYFAYKEMWTGGKSK